MKQNKEINQMIVSLNKAKDNTHIEWIENPIDEYVAKKIEKIKEENVKKIENVKEKKVNKYKYSISFTYGMTIIFGIILFVLRFRTIFMFYNYRSINNLNIVTPVIPTS